MNDGGNYIAIVKCKDGKFKGYSCNTSTTYKSIKDYEKGSKEFTAEDLNEAIEKAQSVYTSYIFVNLHGENKSTPYGITVRELKKFIHEHNIPDDALIFSEVLEKAAEELFVVDGKKFQPLYIPIYCTDKNLYLSAVI